MKTGRVLVVDDDEDLLKSLADILGDGGFKVSSASDGDTALALVDTFEPAVVLLDVWLPGMDGVDILQILRIKHPEIVVLMMSGYGDIATALHTTRLGALDYLEKPFSLRRLLTAVTRAFEQAPKHLRKSSRRQSPVPDGVSGVAALPVHMQPEPRDFAMTPTGAPCRVLSGDSRVDQTAGRVSGARQQRTLRRSVVLYGHGLQSGLKTGLVLSPLPPDSGVQFRNIATGQTMPASVDCIESTDFCTSLRHHCVAAKTVEHLLSALHAYRITNVLVKISNEIPIMDGSAAAFCHLLEEAGIVEQKAIMEDFVVDRCYAIGSPQLDTKFILIEPYDGFRVTYRLVYPLPLGIQEYTYEHMDGRGYLHEIAPARTFAFVKDVEEMHALGLIEGGRLSNVLLIGEENIVNHTHLRFPSECVRHRILDIIGDLYLLGCPVRGHIRANMTGHTENVALVKQLQAARLRTAEAGARC